MKHLIDDIYENSSNDSDRLLQNLPLPKIIRLKDIGFRNNKYTWYRTVPKTVILTTEFFPIDFAVISKTIFYGMYNSLRNWMKQFSQNSVIYVRASQFMAPRAPRRGSLTNHIFSRCDLINLNTSYIQNMKLSNDVFSDLTAGMQTSLHSYCIIFRFSD